MYAHTFFLLGTDTNINWMYGQKTARQQINSRLASLTLWESSRKGIWTPKSYQTQETTEWKQKSLCQFYLAEIFSKMAGMLLDKLQQEQRESGPANIWSLHIWNPLFSLMLMNKSINIFMHGRLSLICPCFHQDALSLPTPPLPPLG